MIRKKIILVLFVGVFFMFLLLFFKYSFLKKNKNQYCISNCNIRHNSFNFNDLFYLSKKIELKRPIVLGNVDQVEILGHYLLVLDSFSTKKVYCFSLSGEFLYKIGKIGQGPGEYMQPLLIIPDQKNIFIFDGGKCSFLVFQGRNFISEKKFLSTLNFFMPFWYAKSKNSIYFYSPRVDDNGYLVYKFDDNLNYLGSFIKDNMFFKKIVVGGIRGIAFVDDKIWVLDFFNSLIEQLDTNGNLMGINKFYQSNGMINMGNEELPKESLKKVIFKKANLIRGIFNLDNKLLVWYEKKRFNIKKRKSYVTFFFDIWNANGTLLYSNIAVPVKNLFIGISNDNLIFCELWSKEIEQKRLNAIIYLYKLKKRNGEKNE